MSHQTAIRPKVLFPALTCVLLNLAIMAPVTAAAAMQDQASQTVEKLVDVGGYRLNSRIIPGRGSVILLESGGGMDLTEWDALAPRLARETGVRVLGPNCVGIYCPKSKLINASYLSRESGPVGMISHSGSMTTLLAMVAEPRGIRFSMVISSGNECDLDATFTSTAPAQAHQYLPKRAALFPPAPVLSLASVYPLGTNGFQFALQGLPGQTYQIETSTNLANWSVIGSVLATNTPVLFLDPAATNHAQRFYRARE